VRSCYAGAKAALKKTSSQWLQPEEKRRSKKAVKGKDE
jgi:hypothetical protein